MSKFVTLVLEPLFNDEYGEYANLPVFNAHGDVVGYTGGEVPETGNPCEFYVMDEEGFPVCHSASENAKLRELCKDIMAFVEDDDACERCGHDVECVEAADGELVLPYEGQCLMLDLFADRMRELGIEVES